jgi:hypothetical protein
VVRHRFDWEPEIGDDRWVPPIGEGGDGGFRQRRHPVWEAGPGVGAFGWRPLLAGWASYARNGRRFFFEFEMILELFERFGI